MAFDDEQQPPYSPEVESVIQSLRGDTVLGYEQRAEQEIESALRVITANLDILSDQDRSLAVRGFRGYLKNDVKDELLKLEIETLVASQLEGAS